MGLFLCLSFGDRNNIYSFLDDHIFDDYGDREMLF